MDGQDFVSDEESSAHTVPVTHDSRSRKEARGLLERSSRCGHASAMIAGNAGIASGLTGGEEERRLCGASLHWRRVRSRHGRKRQ